MAEIKYPSIVLRVENQKPKIEALFGDNSFKSIISSNTEFNEFLRSSLKEFSDKDYSDEELWILVTEGEADSILFPTIEFESAELSFDHLLPAVKAFHEEMYDHSDLSDELTAEIERNWASDMLASLVDQIYNILIARVLFSAQEMGIGDIYLDDDRDEPRLREKMSKELAEVGIELMIRPGHGEDIGTTS